MTSKQLWKLFVQTGRPVLYCVAQRRARHAQRLTRERGGDHAPNHPGNRPAGDQL